MSMKVIYTQDAFPSSTVKSIFLAGPNPRDSNIPSWRPAALQILEGLGFDGDVYLPESKDGHTVDYDRQVAWAAAALGRADVIVFWVPRNLETLPGLTTNVEFGRWVDSGKAILGCPEGAQHVRYLQSMANKFGVLTRTTLEGTLFTATKLLGSGAVRTNGEVFVPLLVWRDPTFQGWYAAQTRAGNSLESAEVLWTFRIGPRPFSWVLHVNMWIHAEQRVKSNEFVFGRPDTSSVCLCYHEASSGRISLRDIEVLLVREFRSPARTPSGYILELPGGSSTRNTDNALLALEELEEETSLKIEPGRLRSVGTRQLAGTLSAHVNTLFAGLLTREERDLIYRLASSEKVFGLSEDTERTYVELHTIGELMARDSVDWTTMGSILLAVATLFP